jgi:hypothetical protein
MFAFRTYPLFSNLDLIRDPDSPATRSNGRVVMTPKTKPSRSARKPNDPLLLAINRLEKALAAEVPGRERDWAQGMNDALAGLEHELRKHLAAAEDSDGLLVDVDCTRPTLARQANMVCRDFIHHLKSARDLRKHVQATAQVFGHPPQTAVNPCNERVTDFGAVRNQARQLLEGLRHDLETEANLVLESVNTEIGVCD